MITRKSLKRVGVCAVLAGWVLFAAIDALAGPGAVDTTFNVIANNTVNALLTQPDGKILVGGAFTQINGINKTGLARLYPDGTLDNTFTNSLFQGAVVNALLMQPDGRNLVGGQLNVSAQAPQNVARLNQDGSADTTFSNSTPSGAVLALALQGDGKILIGGTFHMVNHTNRDLISRLNPDGSMDNGFNPGAISGGSVNALAVQNDGNILMGGSFISFTTYRLNQECIARLLTNGIPDASYAATAFSTVQSIFLQPDGRALLGGAFTSLDLAAHAHAGILNTDGTVYPGFMTTSGANNTVYAVTEDEDGNILLAGSFSTYGASARAGVARLYEDGVLDTAFNKTTNFESPQYYSLALQKDGKILLGGNFVTFNSVGRTNLVRLYGDNYPAEIVTQPQSSIAVVGATVTFSVELSNPTTVNYQWLKNGVAIPGATFEEYTIFNAQMADAGAYSVQANTGFGSTTSSNAMLRVGVPPTIIVSPLSYLAVNEGATASFTSAAEGTGIGYYWSFGTNIILVGRTNLTLTNVMPNQSGFYYFVASNIFGAVTSSRAYLDVMYPITITNNPASRSVLAGGSASFDAAATGEPLYFQWLFNGNSIVGATSSSIGNGIGGTAGYSIANVALTNAGGYSVIVSNQFNSVTSSVATLIVGMVPGSLSPHLNGDGSLTIQMPGTAGFNYVLQTTTNLTPPAVWQNVATNLTDTNGVWSFVDPNTANGGLFYRVSSP